MTYRPSPLTDTAVTESSMAGEFAEPLAGVQVPDRSGTIIGASDDVAAVRGNRHGRHRVSMAGKFAEPLAGVELQTITVWSSEPETTYLPSGVTDTAVTES